MPSHVSHQKEQSPNYNVFPMILKNHTRMTKSGYFNFYEMNYHNSLVEQKI